MLLTVLVLLLFLMLSYALLAPLVFYINTSNNDYYFKFGGLLKACILADKKELLKIKLRVLFVNFYFYPLRKSKDSEEKKKIAGKDAKKKKRTMNLKSGLRFLRSFKIKQFFMNIDTGDCIANAKLYPAFAYLNYRYGGFNINFENKNQLILKLQNRPIYMIRSFINK